MIDLRKFGYANWRLRNWPYNIKRFFKNLKYARQRAIRGWADCDAYDISYYISCVLSEMMNHMADNTHSWPGYLFDTKKEWSEELHNLSDFIYKRVDDEDYFEPSSARDVERYGELGYVSRIAYITALREEDRREIFDRLYRIWDTLWD